MDLLVNQPRLSGPGKVWSFSSSDALLRSSKGVLLTEKKDLLPPILSPQTVKKSKAAVPTTRRCASVKRHVARASSTLEPDPAVAERVPPCLPSAVEVEG
eukprot:s127_g36.t1